MPQDVKLSPDGRLFYVADMHAAALWEIDGRRLRVVGFLRTGAGAHGLYPSRDARFLYVDEPQRGHDLGGQLPHAAASSRPGGSPAAAARTWAASRPTARCSGSPAATTPRCTRSRPATGSLLARIPVGRGPHGLCVWPQPGRYSLGHTGILR